MRRLNDREKTKELNEEILLKLFRTIYFTIKLSWINGVQRRVRTHSGHGLHIYSAYDRLQLAFVQAVKLINVVKKVSGAKDN